MSIRFKNFVERVGKESEFKPMKSQLQNSLIEEAERKYKNYPRLLEMMKEQWPEYERQANISHFLKDHHEEFFYFYFNTLFPFRKRGFNIDSIETPTPVDIKLEFTYVFKPREIEAIKTIIEDLELHAENDKNIDEVAESTMKRIIIFTVSSFGPMVQEIFGRPFAFQFSSIDGKKLDSGEYEVNAIISGREQ
ncbi:MAG: hypothetical protein GF311_17665 [Candidatus Lokiarchaeota archaeon]|nr:hypothetical protein [Candidatus Lokiarchaeota archaeon]